MRGLGFTSFTHEGHTCGPAWPFLPPYTVNGHTKGAMCTRPSMENKGLNGRSRRKVLAVMELCNVLSLLPFHIHCNKPKINLENQLKPSACEALTVTQLSVQEVEALWSSGLRGKTLQLMAERVQRLQRQRTRKDI